MNSSEFSEKVILSLYGELGQEEDQELIRFLADNPSRLKEYKEILRIHSLAGQCSLDVTGELAVSARERLRGALGTKEKEAENSVKAGWLRDLLGIFPVSGWAGTAAGVAFGLLAGFLFFAGGNTDFSGIPDLASLDENTAISNVRFAPLDQDGRRVELSFSATRSFEITDSIDNPEVQRLLAYSLVKESNPGVRINTVEALRNNVVPDGRKEIRQALMTAAVTDENPVVRSEALAALESYPADRELQKTLINVLRFDRNSKVRMDAVNMLRGIVERGIEVSPDNVSEMQRQVEVEENLYMRSQLNQILQEVDLEKL